MNVADVQAYDLTVWRQKWNSFQAAREAMQSSALAEKLGDGEADEEEINVHDLAEISYDFMSNFG